MSLQFSELRIVDCALTYDRTRSRLGLTSFLPTTPLPLAMTLITRQLTSLHKVGLAATDPKSRGFGDLTTHHHELATGVGFGNTAAAVAEQLKDKIRLNSKVVKIDTSSTPGKVIVTCEDANSGSKFRVIANSVAVTVSLNVLKANNINFIPQLPSWKQNVIKGMGMGASPLFLLLCQCETCCSLRTNDSIRRDEQVRIRLE